MATQIESGVNGADGTGTRRKGRKHKEIRGKPQQTAERPGLGIAEDSSGGVIRAGRGHRDPEALRDAIEVVLELAEKRGPEGDREAAALRMVAEALRGA